MLHHKSPTSVAGGRRLPLVRTALLFGFAALFAAPSSAGEVGAFLALPTPTDAWKTGFGFHAAIFSLPFFQAGGEFARIGAEDPAVSITTYTAQVEFNPPSLRIKPFVGVGAGAYRETVGTNTDWGTLTAIFGGLKIPVGPARVRAEVRKVSLSGTPHTSFDKRFSLGVSFGF